MLPASIRSIQLQSWFPNSRAELHVEIERFKPHWHCSQSNNQVPSLGPQPEPCQSASANGCSLRSSFQHSNTATHPVVCTTPCFQSSACPAAGTFFGLGHYCIKSYGGCSPQSQPGLDCYLRPVRASTAASSCGSPHRHWPQEPSDAGRLSVSTQ